MIKVKARAVFGPKESFKETIIERRDLEAKDILIEIKYCGICHSDIHHFHAEWGVETYPLVPGHEIAGVVTEVGSDVTKYKVGDHVGVGCMVDSCRECVNCKKGEEQFCLKGNIGTYGKIDKYGKKTEGGYSTHIVVTEDFVLKIPESIGLDIAAPLLCAGITTYSPLHHWNAGPGKKVAILGLGGLGHMAVKIAHAMGAHVTVLSHSSKKREDAMRLGSDNYYDTSDEETFKKLSGNFDLIINATSSSLTDQLPPLPEDLLANQGSCYDLAYSNKDTVFVRWGLENKALKSLDGLGMLVEQAAEAFTIWRGVRPQTTPIIDLLNAERN